MAHFEQIWFDMDGTLAVPTPAWNEAHDLLRYEVYADAIGSTEVNEKIIQEYEALYLTHKSNSAVFKSLGLPADYWIAHFIEADLSRYYEPRRDVTSTLEELTKRATLGIFTNNKLPIITKTLEHLQIPEKIFKKILSADEASERKPHAHGFELMLKMAGCEPADLLYVGDRYAVDVEPAQKLGAKGALVWSTDERADFSFPEFTDLLQINNDY